MHFFLQHQIHGRLGSWFGRTVIVSVGYSERKRKILAQYTTSNLFQLDQLQLWTHEQLNKFCECVAQRKQTKTHVCSQYRQPDAGKTYLVTTFRKVLHLKSRRFLSGFRKQGISDWQPCLQNAHDDHTHFGLRPFGARRLAPQL